MRVAALQHCSIVKNQMYISNAVLGKLRTAFAMFFDDNGWYKKEMFLNIDKVIKYM